MPISLAEIPPYRPRPPIPSADSEAPVVTTETPPNTLTNGNHPTTSTLTAPQLSIPSLSIFHQNGHTSALSGRISAALLSHVLFLKGQIPLPVAQLIRNSQRDISDNQSKASRKRAELIEALDTLASHLPSTFAALGTAFTLRPSDGSDSPTSTPNANEMLKDDSRTRAVIAFVFGPNAVAAKGQVMLVIDGLEVQVWGARNDIQLPGEGVFINDAYPSLHETTVNPINGADTSFESAVEEPPRNPSPASDDSDTRSTSSLGSVFPALPKATNADLTVFADSSDEEGTPVPKGPSTPLSISKLQHQNGRSPLSPLPIPQASATPTRASHGHKPSLLSQSATSSPFKPKSTPDLPTALNQAERLLGRTLAEWPTSALNPASSSFVPLSSDAIGSAPSTNPNPRSGTPAHSQGLAAELPPTCTTIYIRAPRWFDHPMWSARQREGEVLDKELVGLLESSGLSEIKGKQEDEGKAKRAKKGRMVTDGLYVEFVGQDGKQRKLADPQVVKVDESTETEEDDLIWWGWTMNGSIVGFSD